MPRYTLPPRPISLLPEAQIPHLIRRHKITIAPPISRQPYAPQHASHRTPPQPTTKKQKPTGERATYCSIRHLKYSLANILHS